MQQHSSYITKAKVSVCWFDCYSASWQPFICIGAEDSTNIMTLPHIVACVWHLLLQFGKLV